MKIQVYIWKNIPLTLWDELKSNYKVIKVSILLLEEEIEMELLLSWIILFQFTVEIVKELCGYILGYE